VAEDGVRTVQARRLEQIHGTDGIDVEIVERSKLRQIVGWLGGAVDDEIERSVAKKTIHALAIANV
jgi:hypothetical protein